MHDRYVELAVLATRCVQLQVLPRLLLPLLVRAIWNYKNENQAIISGIAHTKRSLYIAFPFLQRT